MPQRCLSALVVLSFALMTFSVPALAQTESRSRSAGENASTGAPTTAPGPAKTNAVNPKYTTPKSALDTAYGAKIAEYTTEKYFMA
jgi:hypothetical protein